MEAIFSSDIVGTSSSVLDRTNACLLNEDIAEVVEELEEVGFRTPTVYSAKTGTVDRSLKCLERSDYRDKVAKFLEKIECDPVQDDLLRDDLLQDESIGTGNVETPMRMEKSYLRPTQASTRKRRILGETNVQPSTPLHNRTSKTANTNPASKTSNINLGSKTPNTNLVSKTPNTNVVPKTPTSNRRPKTPSTTLVSRTPQKTPSARSPVIRVPATPETPRMKALSCTAMKAPATPLVPRTPVQKVRGTPVFNRPQSSAKLPDTPSRLVK